jgi:hypothetical protein
LELAVVKEAPRFLDPSTMLAGSRYQRLQAKLLMLEERRKQQRKLAAKQPTPVNQAKSDDISSMQAKLNEMRARNQTLRTRLELEQTVSGCNWPLTASSITQPWLTQPWL